MLKGKSVGNTLGSTLATNTSQRADDHQVSETINFGGAEDLSPLPRRLRDVQKDRVILIQKGSALCDNMGLAYVNYMDLKRGRYRLYFMRIENEQRIMFNSKLDVIGASNQFSLNNVVSSSLNEEERIR